MGDLALAQALHSLCQKVKHPHSRKSESTMIRKTANSHNWTRVYCQEIKGKGRVELQSWLTRESSQTQEADAANLKAPSMALSWSEAKTPTRPVYHTPSLSLLFLTLAQTGPMHRGPSSAVLLSPASTEKLRKLSLSSSRHGHNPYQLCCRCRHQQLLRVPVKEPKGGDEVTW